MPENKDIDLSKDNGQSQVTWEYLQSLGLRDGEYVPQKDQVFKNAGWYNIDGEKVGWGDLSAQNIHTLSIHLTEPLLILTEQNSYSNFKSFMEFSDSTGRKPENVSMIVNRTLEKNPGIEYVLSKLDAAIMPAGATKHPGSLFKIVEAKHKYNYRYQVAIRGAEIDPKTGLAIIERKGVKMTLFPSYRVRDLLGHYLPKKSGIGRLFTSFGKK